MRNTMDLDKEVLDRAEGLERQRGVQVDTVVNEALRIGLGLIVAQPITKPYRAQPHPMGLRSGYNLDNIQELLSRAEGEATR